MKQCEDEGGDNFFDHNIKNKKGEQNFEKQ